MAKDLTVLVHVWYPRKPQDQQSLFELALSDAALFHTIMCSSSLYLDIASGSAESPHIIIHKMEAIHLINAKLQDSSGVSDATIGAVAFLAIVEVCHCSAAIYVSVKITFDQFVLGNSEAWSLHRNGLIKMLHLRGGWKTLSPSLRRKVCMQVDPDQHFLGFY